MKAEKILENYFPLVIADEDEWAIHVVKAMHEFSKQENKKLIEENEKLCEERDQLCAERDDLLIEKEECRTQKQ